MFGMRKMAKENIVVVCTIVLCIMLTLATCVSFSEGGILAAFGRVESKAVTIWAVACGGFSNVTIARQSAEMIKSRGGAGYVQSGEKIEIVYAVYKSEEAAQAVLAKLADKSLYLKKIEIQKGSFKWCKDDVKSAVQNALGYFDIAFDALFDCSNSLNEGSCGIEDVKTKIKVLRAQIVDIKSVFYQNTVNCKDEQITQIKLALVTTLALLDNVDFAKNNAYITSSIRYQAIQLALCRQALMSSL